MVARPSQEYGSPALPLLWRLTGRESTLGGRRSYRPTMDTFTELRQLADVLTELGDNATAALVRQAIDRFMAGSSRPARNFWSGRSRNDVSTNTSRPGRLISTPARWSSRDPDSNP